MQIQVNTDHTIEGHEALADQIRGVGGECSEPNERSHHAGGGPPDRRERP
jgi:hypothetical protein